MEEDMNEKDKNESNIEMVDIDNSSNGDDVDVQDVLAEEETEEKLVDWAYSVMDWLVCAVEARAWDKIIVNADDIITAFILLVKEEHRGIVMDTLKRMIKSISGGENE